jgi:hypothetical protein
MLPRARTQWRDWDCPFTRYCTSNPQPGLDGLRDGLPGALAFFRVQKREEQFVSERQIVQHAEKSPGRIRPKQLVRREIQIPYANAGSFDTEPKALVSDGILRRGMLDGGQVWPFIAGRG